MIGNFGIKLALLFTNSALGARLVYQSFMLPPYALLLGDQTTQEHNTGCLALSPSLPLDALDFINDRATHP